MNQKGFSSSDENPFFEWYGNRTVLCGTLSRALQGTFCKKFLDLKNFCEGEKYLFVQNNGDIVGELHEVPAPKRRETRAFSCGRRGRKARKRDVIPFSMAFDGRHPILSSRMAMIKSRCQRGPGGLFQKSPASFQKRNKVPRVFFQKSGEKNKCYRNKLCFYSILL